VRSMLADLQPYVTTRRRTLVWLLHGAEAFTTALGLPTLRAPHTLKALVDELTQAVAHTTEVITRLKAIDVDVPELSMPEPLGPDEVLSVRSNGAYVHNNPAAGRCCGPGGWRVARKRATAGCQAQEPSHPPPDAHARGRLRGEHRGCRAIDEVRGRGLCHPREAPCGAPRLERDDAVP
jgi:hypothetical protein